MPTTTSTGLPVKRLVIENVSGNCDLTPGISGFLLELRVVAGSSDQFFVPFSLVPASPSNSPGRFVVGGSAVRIYTDPGETVIMESEFGLSTIHDFGLCNITVAGHLETK